VTALLRVPVPAGTAHSVLFPALDPDGGTVVFSGRPARASWAIGQDLLAGMGKRDDVTGAGRNHHDDLSVIQAWLSAHRVGLVVARHADWLPPDVLDSLTLLAAAAQARLAFVHDDGQAQHVVDHVTRHGGTVAPWQPLAKELTPPTSPRPRGTDGAFPVYLPRVAFPLFRAACRDLLTSPEHRLVDALYVASFRAWANTRPTGDLTAHDTLTGLLTACATPAEAVVVARACQAAALVDGHHLQVDLRTLLIEVDAGRHRPLTQPELASLRAYRQPWRAVAVALHDAEISNAEIAALNVGDVDRDGALTDGPAVGPHTATYLRAQRTWRLLSGAAARDPLIEVDGRYLHTGLLRAGLDLNLPVAPPKTGRGQRRADRWRHTLGLTLVPVTGNVAFTKETA